MDQEYLEDKVVTLRKLTGYQRLREVFGLAMLIVAIYLIIALGSFDRADPSWSQTGWYGPVQNAGGRFGAWVADILFSIFGVVAYLLPIMLFIYSWNVFKQRYSGVRLDYFTLSLRVIGFLALILSSCSLADLNFDDWYNFTSGGVIGSLMSNAVIPSLNHLGATLVLLFMWLVGLTLFTGWSWLTISEKVGSIIMTVATFIFNKLRSKDNNADDDTAEHHYNDDNDEANAAAFERDDILLTSVTADSEHDESEDEYYVPENQLAFNLDITSDASEESKPAIQFVPQYPPIETEPTIAPLHQVPTKTESGVKQQTTTDDRISQLINTMVNQHHSDDRAEIHVSQEIAPTLTNSPIKVEKPLFTPVKTRVVPDLPRPNPVRIPTRRELMSYGIRIPSQAHNNTADSLVNDKLSIDVSDSADLDAQLHEARLYRQFVEQQKERYGEEYLLDENESAKSTLSMTNADNAITSSIDSVSPIHSNSVANYDSNLSERQDLAKTQISDGITSNTVAESEKQVLAYEYKDSFNPMPNTLRQNQSEKDFDNSIPKTQTELRNEYSNEALIDFHNDRANNEQTSKIDEFNTPYQYVNDSVDVPLTESIQTASQSVHNTVINKETPENDTGGLIHPFLVRNDKPLQKPTTPLPTLNLLTTPPVSIEPVDYEELERIARLIEDRLADYRVKANVVGILPGPVITLYELDLAPGVKAARISNLSRDLARSLSTVAVRVVEVIPGRPYVGLELPNKHRQTVYVREVLDCAKFREMASPLAIVLGKDISGEPVVADLAKMPHVLVAGTTGSGKSVGVNAMIISMLYKATPDDVRFIMIDPKMLELSVYEGIPHLLTEVVTDMKDAANALRWCVSEMERRYKLMSALGVRNLTGYNERIQQAIDMGRPVPDPFWKPTDSMDMNCPTLEKLPYIVVIVDEFADLMMAVGKKVEELIARLAQKARAAGIHLVLATQRPSVDVITGLIKANIPTRIAFTVSSKIDSRTILDQGGAESLLGMGDMLYLAPNSSTPVRVHGAFVHDEEVHAVVQDWKARGKPEYIDSITSTSEENENGFSFDSGEDLDPLFDQAVAFVVEKRKPSISGVQRQFRIGYNRAARIIEQMEAQGIVSPPGNNGNREVLAPPPHD